jgi:hypothetical protein
MKTQEISTDESVKDITKESRTALLGKRLLVMGVGALLALCATAKAKAEAYSLNTMQLVSCITTDLLTARLTVAQRQLRHAQNFNQLPAAVRPLYLHTVAYSVGFGVASGGQLPTSSMLVQHLQTVTSIYVAPAIPPQYSDLVTTRLAIAKAALQELNQLITIQVANNTSLQNAMDAGIIDSFVWWDDWW